jgi:hypothetical protein
MALVRNGKVAAPIAFIALVSVACTAAPSGGEPRLPAGSAGRILGRAIEAAGGWKRWSEVEDVAIVSSFSLYDPRGDLASQTIGVLESRLHQSPRARLESIGLPEPPRSRYSLQRPSQSARRSLASTS